ncbi:Detected protein of unknown function [Hibiscus syriacus]|uniref:Uncharacterized protein n=1 Tax=Hibiscus syriacus TaxID=106335 RepID=A0A6A2Z7P9_HIBSY|nr:uncharacterized protein LOC120150152 [Hibiscus syriacus]KAE8687470.1 Detected protein of unknown function [Hibiscus syriacus]
MSVAVLKPEDCLKLPNTMKHLRNSRPNPNRTNGRKRSTKTSSPPSTTVAPLKAPAMNLVMGQVKILKRGEDLKESKPDKPMKLENENVDVDLRSTNSLGRDPVSDPTQIRPSVSVNDSNKVLPFSFYAGSAFVTSPPPSSVPLPAFFTKKIGVALKDDVATSVLRRMLRLEL